MELARVLLPYSKGCFELLGISEAVFGPFLIQGIDQRLVGDAITPRDFLRDLNTFDLLPQMVSR
jgi:hypothetical protein